MATKRKKRAPARRRTKKKVPRRHVKRGCGKRNWRRGSNAMWKCKTGKRRPYKRKSR